MIFSAIVLAFIGLLAVVSIRFARRFNASTKGERKELLQLWEDSAFDEIYSQSKNALESRPMDYFLLTMRGFSAYQLGISQINSLNAAGYFDDCVWSLRKALLLKDAEKDGRLYYVLGKAYNYKGMSYADLAVRYLNYAQELSYNAADIPEYLGLAYAAIGDYRNSVAAFSEALDPETVLIWEQGDDAPSSVNSVSTGPSGPLLLAIARSYIALEELELARAYLRHCVDSSPDFRSVLAARLLLADVLQKSGDNDGAKLQLESIIETTSENAEAHYQLGELYALQGETARARAEWRLAVRADPAHVKARTRLSM